MKLLVQRVKKAKVINKKTGRLVGEIGKGLFVLVGIKKGDTPKEAKYLAEKLAKLRVMADEKGKMNLSVKDISGEILVVSQFTLYGDTKGQNRPSFVKAANSKEAEPVYNQFIENLKSLCPKVQTGSFGDYMQTEVSLDGPVTIELEI